MNTKAKGNRNEHRSIALLEAAGYRCTRAAASLGIRHRSNRVDGHRALPGKDSRLAGQVEAIKDFPVPTNA